MGRSKKASRRAAFLVLLLAGGLALWQLERQGDTQRLMVTAFVVVWVLLVLIAVWLPTTCDVVSNASGRTCDNDAYGWLRACHLQAHKRAKRRALVAMLRLRRVASRQPRGWQPPTAQPPTAPAAPAAPAAPRSATPPTHSIPAQRRPHGAGPRRTEGASVDPVPVVLARSGADRAILVATVVGTACGVVQLGLVVI